MGKDETYAITLQFPEQADSNKMHVLGRIKFEVTGTGKCEILKKYDGTEEKIALVNLEILRLDNYTTQKRIRKKYGRVGGIGSQLMGGVFALVQREFGNHFQSSSLLAYWKPSPAGFYKKAFGYQFVMSDIEEMSNRIEESDEAKDDPDEKKWQSWANNLRTDLGQGNMHLDETGIKKLAARYEIKEGALYKYQVRLENGTHTRVQESETRLCSVAD